MRSRKSLIFMLTLTLLTLGIAGAATAVEAETETETEEVTLTGELSQDTTGEFMLTDPESEAKVSLRGSEDDLAEKVGMTVAVTGSWAEADDGEMYFQVSAVAAA